MWRDGASFPGKRIIKVCPQSLSSHSFLTVEQVGTLDDTSILDNLNMNAELFVDHRPKWVGVQEGAAQKATM
jgi:hypothetical protein